MPAESTEIDAHNSHVRRRITCEYVAFLGGKHDNQTDARVGVQFETTSTFTLPFSQKPPTHK